MRNKRIYITLIISVFCLAAILLTSCTEANAQEQIQTYDVVSVYIYEYPITNRVGGIHDVEIRYYFTYLNADGKLCHEEDFFHSYKYERVELGDKDQFVINPNDDTRILYLTRETMNRLNQVTN